MTYFDPTPDTENIKAALEFLWWEVIVPFWDGAYFGFAFGAGLLLAFYLFSNVYDSVHLSVREKERNDD